MHVAWCAGSCRAWRGRTARANLLARFVTAAGLLPGTAPRAAHTRVHERRPSRACRQQPNVSVTVHTPPLSASHRRRAALQRARLRCGCRALMAASRGRPSRLRSHSASSYSCAASVTGIQTPCSWGSARCWLRRALLRCWRTDRVQAPFCEAQLLLGTAAFPRAERWRLAVRVAPARRRRCRSRSPG